MENDKMNEYVKEEAANDKLADRLANITPKDMGKINKKKEELLERTIAFEKEADMEAVVKHFNKEIPADLKQDVFETLSEFNPPTASNATDGLDKSILEDELIKSKKIDRKNIILGKIKDGSGRRFKETDAKLVEILLSHLWRLVTPEDISKDLIVEKRKQYIDAVLLNEEVYSQYRHKFIYEEYKNILGPLSQKFKADWGEAYLREAFMVINVIYKFCKDAETLDDQTIASIIVDNNDILPSTQMYGKPFTMDFLLDLSKNSVFKKIRKLCNDEMLIDKIISLSSMVAKMIDEMSVNPKADVKEIGALAKLLTDIQKISESISRKDESEVISYVYHDQVADLNYDEMGYLVKVDPYDKREFDFRYYITCYDEDTEGNEVFKGWLVYSDFKKKYVSSFESIKVFEIKNGDIDAEKKFRKILNDVRENGEHKKYVVNKLIDREHVLNEII